MEVEWGEGVRSVWAPERTWTGSVSREEESGERLPGYRSSVSLHFISSGAIFSNNRDRRLSDPGRYRGKGSVERLHPGTGARVVQSHR